MLQKSPIYRLCHRFLASHALLCASRTLVASSSCGRACGPPADSSVSVVHSVPPLMAHIFASLVSGSMEGAARSWRARTIGHHPKRKAGRQDGLWMRPLLILRKLAVRVRGVFSGMGIGFSSYVVRIPGYLAAESSGDMPTIMRSVRLLLANIVKFGTWPSGGRY